MIFVIMPTWLHHTFQMRTLDTFYDPGPLWKDYIIFGMLAGSELSLSSIAYALPLPSWISSIHLFVYIFCTYTCLTLLYLYGYKQSIWMYVASPIIAPGSAVYAAIYLILEGERVGTVCSDPTVIQLVCPWNPYALRQCCVNGGWQCYSKKASNELLHIYWSLIFLKPLYIILIVIMQKWNSITQLILIGERRRRKKNISELEEFLKHEVVMAEGKDETLLREAAIFAKVQIDRFLRTGSVVFKDACIKVHCSQPTTLNLVIDPGSCFGILGLAGVGKSTLLKVIRGELKLEYGTVYVNGAPKTDPAKIGYFSKQIEVPQEMQLIELLLTHAELHRMPYAFRQNSVEALATIFGVADRLRSTMSTLTKGERRLVAVMSAFVGKPPIVLLDEPTAEVDLQTKEVIWKAISNIRGYCTIIIATNTLDDFEHFSFDKTIVMADLDVKMILKFKELEARVCRGYSITIKVHHLSITDSRRREYGFEVERRERMRMRDLIKPIRNWVHHRLPKAVPVVDAGRGVIHVTQGPVRMLKAGIPGHLIQEP
ncbi:ATP-binding cassette sub-family A member 17-like isoform X2 [Varroa destructor]|uniref:ABC transporter domain-containing protein n=1 Tax=Varroa destructor TaxID=109461 RepID=A0A7M7MDD8_VARDE|nr:ATP-binding cassette sub-family A member 17-like isoform X2 [Varroa destructor]